MDTNKVAVVGMGCWFLAALIQLALVVLVFAVLIGAARWLWSL